MSRRSDTQLFLYENIPTVYEKCKVIARVQLSSDKLCFYILMIKYLEYNGRLQLMRGGKYKYVGVNQLSGPKMS